MKSCRAWTMWPFGPQLHAGPSEAFWMGQEAQCDLPAKHILVHGLVASTPGQCI